MTAQQASARARAQSKRYHDERFVVFAPEDDDGRGPYFVASAFDLDTFYLGGPEPLACYIDGESSE